jgi:hypothetical protein
MSNMETGVPNSAVTNQAGFYSIPTLQVGAYTLTAEREGFRKRHYLRPDGRFVDAILMALYIS